jgi:hypothetical protein
MPPHEKNLIPHSIHLKKWIKSLKIMRQREANVQLDNDERIMAAQSGIPGSKEVIELSASYIQTSL